MNNSKEVTDPQGREFSLSRERWSHVVSHHGELSNMKDNVLKTVEAPDNVEKQPSRNDTLHYYRGEEDLRFNTYICVVINIEKEFIVTAYPTDNNKP